MTPGSAGGLGVIGRHHHAGLPRSDAGGSGGAAGMAGGIVPGTHSALTTNHLGGGGVDHGFLASMPAGILWGGMAPMGPTAATSQPQQHQAPAPGPHSRVDKVHRHHRSNHLA